MTARNVYSRLWFSTFLGDIDAAIVAPEVAFIERQLPRDRVQSILDLCCGPGRHLAPLVDHGYDVIGIDLDAHSILAARAGVHAADHARLIRGDMCALPLRSACLDAVICMWQSFGHFDIATNRGVLADIARTLRPGGCLLLDVYHREFYERTQGERRIERYGLRVVEQRWMDAGRLYVTLRYEYQDADQRPAGVDAFDWQLYTPDELIAEAAAVGLAARLACCKFDESRPPIGDESRMQLIFEQSSSTATATGDRA